MTTARNRAASLRAPPTPRSPPTGSTTLTSSATPSTRPCARRPAIGHRSGARLLEVGGRVDRGGIAIDPAGARGLAGVRLVACGTAWRARLIGRAMRERLARVPCDAGLASEYRSREPIVTAN